MHTAALYASIIGPRESGRWQASVPQAITAQTMIRNLRVVFGVDEGDMKNRVLVQENDS
jgi:hypothetical protein